MIPLLPRIFLGVAGITRNPGARGPKNGNDPSCHDAYDLQVPFNHAVKILSKDRINKVRRPRRGLLLLFRFRFGLRFLFRFGFLFQDFIIFQ